MKHSGSSSITEGERGRDKQRGFSSSWRITWWWWEPQPVRWAAQQEPGGWRPPQGGLGIQVPPPRRWMPRHQEGSSSWSGGQSVRQKERITTVQKAPIRFSFDRWFVNDFYSKPNKNPFKIRIWFWWSTQQKKTSLLLLTSSQFPRVLQWPFHT